ncbi:MAG: sulfide/dihydroorotate dehydrogenase-like FAD/NAD-binding protein [Bacteroidales bacterium]|jgi:ferredoxin--NADP+ reductase|nr:sulfide/dihydroorotate dehydrogenase-like FAD/NAD-binding protein [Bacteroidales bacterium]
MNQILSKEYLSEKVVKLEIHAPWIAKNRRAGHFVIVKIGKTGERIPLTISSSDLEKGTITLIIQKVGVTSSKVANLEIGDKVTDLLGPLGMPANIEYFGTVLCSGGGVGVAPLFPVIKELKNKGNRVLTVLAARSKDLIILEKEIRSLSDEVIIMTDDGSYGQKGLVTKGLEYFINHENIDLSITIGPAVMMKFVSLLTKKHEIPTIASLNSIMVDGTGMCGACRVTVGGQTKFVCVDGPEFNAHEIEWDELLMRLNCYKEEENIANSITLE